MKLNAAINLLQLAAIQEFCSATKEYCPKGDPGPMGPIGLTGKSGGKGTKTQHNPSFFLLLSLIF